jgi:NAD(P)-dependent dehydrogenase (short-subunit alcohol dehydrogenase family)
LNGSTAHGPNGVAQAAPPLEPRAPHGATPAAAPAAAAPAAAAPDREQLAQRLLAIVSERTGYPAEMLTLEADLEADLGIDSIKRVEIAGTMVRSLHWPSGGPPDLERLTGSRTLRQVVEQLEAMLASAAGPAPPQPKPGRDQAHPFEDGRSDTRIDRFVVKPVFAPPVTRQAGLSPAGVIVMIDDRSGVGEQLTARLGAEGRRVVRVVPEGPPSSNEGDLLVADIGRPEEVSRLVDQLHDRHGTAAALVHLAALRPGGDPNGVDPGRWRGRLVSDLESLFLLAQALRPDLERAASDGGAAVLAATGLGGTLAADGLGPEFFPGDGGITGFLKTLAREWPSVRVKAVDVDPAAPREVIADDLRSELWADDGVVEVGYRDGQRTALRLAEAPLDSGGSRSPLATDSVVLVTGGARGITAEAAIRLASAYLPTLLLVGRTPPPTGPEPPETAGLTDARALRQALIDRHRGEGRTPPPGRIEDEYRRLLREREVRRNLGRLTECGARAEYLTCDVSDPDAFGDLIARVYRTHGRIDGVIHGAGNIEDKLVHDKSLESFRRVLGAKVYGALTLAGALRPESLRFLVFFGSVSGRFGNRGQADYAAANEILNKLAQQLDRHWPGRVVSINWGPWLSAGMVSPEVRQQFAARGVALIPIEDGCRRLDEELRLGRKGDVEVLIGGVEGPVGEVGADSTAPPLASGGPVGRGVNGERSELPLLAEGAVLSRDGADVIVDRALDLAFDRYLDDHRIDGRPVLPFAVAMELMAEAAAAGWPEYEVLGLRDIRLLRGIVVDGQTCPVRVVCRPSSGPSAPGVGPGSERTLDVAIVSPGTPHRVHYRALVELGQSAGRDTPHGTPSWQPADLTGVGTLPMSLEEAYQMWLFHGPLLQGIAAVEAIGPGGARAALRRSSPRACLGGDPRGQWLIDPVVLDSAFQAQVLWARMHWELTLLPAVVRSYRRVVPSRGGPERSDPGAHDEIRLEMRMAAGNQNPLCNADHYFFDQQGYPLALVTGVEAAGSKALNRLAGGARR